MANKQVVLDASAVLAYLQAEKGCELVFKALSEGRALISAVNYTEVVGKLLESGMPADAVQTVMNKLEINVENYDADQAWQAGVLRMATKILGLSLGDRACLALAAVKKLPVLTTDKCWSDLTLGLDVIQLR
jgi:ribonuclease VapC